MIINRRDALPDTSLDLDLLLIVLGGTALVMLLSAWTTLGDRALLAVVAAIMLGLTARFAWAWRAMKRTERSAPLLGRPVGFMMVASIAAGMVVSTLVRVPDGWLVLHMVVTLLIGQTLETWRARRAGRHPDTL